MLQGENNEEDKHYFESTGLLIPFVPIHYAYKFIANRYNQGLNRMVLRIQKQIGRILYFIFLFWFMFFSTNI